MIYLLDTDSLIFMIRGIKSSNPDQAMRERAHRLVDRCRQTQSGGNTVAISAITVAELEFGASQSAHSDTELQAMNKVLSPFSLLHFDPLQSPARYGEVRHALESTGQLMGAMDLLIAAHSLSHQATLVTNNTARFAGVPGLCVENWS